MGNRQSRKKPSGILAPVRANGKHPSQASPSENYYRALFNSIDEGFCVIEKIGFEAASPLDFLYLEANTAFTTQSGVGNVVGKTIREVFPAEPEPEKWFEIYDKILKTGEPLRFERDLITQGRVLELYAFRVEDETCRHVAVIFKDITDRKRAEQLYAEREREKAINEERQRLARDLHDAVSQALFSASVIAEMLPRMWNEKPERALAQLPPLHQLIRGAAAEMRTLLRELRPESIVTTKLSELFSQLAHAAQARTEIAVDVQTHGDEENQLPSEVHMVFYRIAQECMNNILKHSQATKVTVKLRRTASYTALIIHDNGKGFDSEQTSSGLGLSIMRERAKNVGATLDVKSCVGCGTRMRLLWHIPSVVGA